MTTGLEAAVNTSRRGFLRGRVRPEETPRRPPWARAEAEFTSRCTRCAQCQSACPTGILRTGDGAYPTVDFRRGECTFCGACVSACVPQALTRYEGVAPWTLRATISDGCLAVANVVCRSCGDGCEAQAIRFPPRLGGVARPEIDSARCNGCGACVAPCPATAISMTTKEKPGVRT